MLLWFLYYRYSRKKSSGLVYLVNYNLGIWVGSVLLIVGLVTIMSFTGFKIAANPYNNSLIIMVMLIGFVIQSFTEELLFRDYIYHILSLTFNPFLSCLLQAVIFVLIHTLNNGFSSVPFFNLLLFGLLTEVMFLKSNNVFMSSGFHLIWNALPSLLFGLNISGISTVYSYLDLKLIGNSFYTGGNFGIEGSIIILFLVIVTTIFISVISEKNNN